MTKLNAELRARVESMDAEELYVSLEEVIKQFEGFDGTAKDSESFEHPSGCVTVAVVRSEAGDEFLEVFPGALSTQEVAVEVFLSTPTGGASPTSCPSVTSEFFRQQQSSADRRS